MAQTDFVGVVRYTLGTPGVADAPTDSMTVVFDKMRIMVILYIPDDNKIIEKIFVDDLTENKSYKIDKEKKIYSIDSLSLANPYEFKNTNSLGQVRNELCLRYKANMEYKDKSSATAAECLGAINFMKSGIKDYSFLGVQPLIVDNRIVMDLTVTKSNGSRSSITVSGIETKDNVDSYFDFWGFRENK